MKGFINKRDKIKWGDGPFQPEFSEEKIAGMISDSEVIAGAVADAVEAEAETILGSGTDFAAGVASIADTQIASANLQDLNNVNISGVRTDDVLTYSDGEWGNKHPEKWELIDTITADGTVDKIRKSLEGGLYTGFFITSNLKTGAADASFGIVFEFDSSTFDTPVRKAIGDVTGGIPASGQSYINACYEKDGNMWNGYMTSKVAASTSVANRIERLDSFYIEPNMEFGQWIRITTIEIRTTSSGAVLPENSTFTIYGKR